MNRYRSQAQKAKFKELLEEKKITQKQFNEWERNSKNKPLPYRLKPKSKT